MARTIASTMAGTIASTMAGTMASAMANTTHSPEAIPLETLVKHSPELLGTQHAENGVLSTENSIHFPAPTEWGWGLRLGLVISTESAVLWLGPGQRLWGRSQ